ncbi:MAG: fibronectin type III domain-containing protein [Bacteroidetes bacterium]|nr:fibronectin type III domain-containing protein [Bacteroidota bacterium]
MINHISLSFLKLGTYDKCEFSRDTTVQMLARAIYNPPKIAYADIALKADETVAAYTAYKNNPNEANKNIWLAKENELDGLMRQQANSVAVLANGDAVIMTDAGFHTADDERTAPPLPTEIEAMTAKRGPFPASIEVNCNSMRQLRVNNYVCIIMAGNWIAPVVNGNVITLAEGSIGVAMDSSNDRHKIFPNLNPGTNYWVAMYAVNSTGAGPINSPIRVMAAN